MLEILTNSRQRLARRWLLLLPLAALVAGGPAHAQQMKWDFYKKRDMTPPAAVLSFGVPETDNQQFRASCEGAGPIITAFAADVTGLPEGAPVDVVFAGQGFGETVPARASGVQAGTGITGVVFNTRPADPLWVAMSELEQITYSVGGKPPRPLALDGSKSQIAQFLEACQQYAAQAAQGPVPGVEPAPPAEGEAPPPPAATTGDLGPGTSSWTNFNLALDEGNASAYAAGVTANGMRLSAYCTPAKRLLMLIEEARPGAYPQYEERVQQGLSTPIGMGFDPSAGRMVVSFPNGAAVPGTAYYQGLDGSISVTSPTDRGGFAPNGPEVQNLLSQSTVTFSAAPFKQTFQLNGSKNAICDVLNRCEAVVPACGAEGVLIEPAPRCPLGRIRVDNQCMTRPEARTYCGPGYRPGRGTCVPR